MDIRSIGECEIQNSHLFHHSDLVGCKCHGLFDIRQPHLVLHGKGVKFQTYTSVGACDLGCAASLHALAVNDEILTLVLYGVYLPREFVFKLYYPSLAVENECKILSAKFHFQIYLRTVLCIILYNKIGEKGIGE